MLRFALCENRHLIIANDGQEVREAIFPKSCLLDVEWAEKRAREFWAKMKDVDEPIEIYVTGFTLSALSLLKTKTKSFSFMHWDSSAKIYKKQEF